MKLKKKYTVEEMRTLLKEGKDQFIKELVLALGKELCSRCDKKPVYNNSTKRLQIEQWTRSIDRLVDSYYDRYPIISFREYVTIQWKPGKLTKLSDDSVGDYVKIIRKGRLNSRVQLANGETVLLSNDQLPEGLV